ncbi:Neutral and basic amino acid transport protein rBAT [Mactra antiquata]
MGKDTKQKLGFCESNKCACLMFLVVVGAIAAVVCVTLLVEDIRDIYDHGENNSSLKWWQKTIIYQIYPRSFQDSDGDGIGDLKGIISRLDYFEYIHVDTIWLSPFFESPMKDFGYDVSNYTAIAKVFGTMEDFDELMKQAKKRGIRVIIDFVPNHSSTEHEWFNRSRHAKDDKDPFWDFYVWNDGITLANGTRVPPNNWESVFGGSAWKLDSIRNTFYYHAFLTSQADLNYRNPFVLEKIGEVIRFWMNKGVDGLRIDAIPHLFEAKDTSLNVPKPVNGEEPDTYKYTKNQPEIFNVVKQWRKIVNEFGPDRFLLAETFGIPKEERPKYYEAGSVPFYFKLIGAKNQCGATAACLQGIIQEGLDISGSWPNFVIGNHDNLRIADSMGQKYADAMNLMLLTLPGTPTTYYGEELGMKGGDYKGLPSQDPFAITSGNPNNSRDSERNPMQWNNSINAGFTSGKPWLPITTNTDYENVNVESMKTDNTSSLNLYRRLAEIRQLPAFRTTNIMFPDKVGKVLVYERYDDQTSYLIVINVDSSPQRLDLRAGDITTGVRIFSTKYVTEERIELGNIFLQPGEGVIIRMDD